MIGNKQGSPISNRSEVHALIHDSKLQHNPGNEAPAKLTRTRTLSESSAQSSVSGASAVDLMLRLKHYEKHWIPDKESKIPDSFLSSIVEEDIVNNLCNIELSTVDHNKTYAKQMQEYNAEEPSINIMKDKYRAQTIVQSWPNLTPHNITKTKSEKRYIEVDSDEIANTPDQDLSIKNKRESITITLRSPKVRLTPVRPVLIQNMFKKISPDRSTELQRIPSKRNKDRYDSSEMITASKTKPGIPMPPNVNYVIPQECQQHIVEAETENVIQESTSNTTTKINPNSEDLENKVPNSDAITDMPHMKLYQNKSGIVCDSTLRGNLKNINCPEVNLETAVKIKRKTGKHSSKAQRSTKTKITDDIPPLSSKLSPIKRTRRSLYSPKADFIVQASEKQKTQLQSTTSVVLKKTEYIDKIEKPDEMSRHKLKVPSILIEDPFDKLISESAPQAGFLSAHSLSAVNAEDIAIFNLSSSDDDFQEKICQNDKASSNNVLKMKKSIRLHGRPKKYKNSNKNKYAAKMLINDQKLLKSANYFNVSNKPTKDFGKEFVESKLLEKLHLEIVHESDRTNKTVSNLDNAINVPNLLIDELMRKTVILSNNSDICTESINDTVYENEIVEPKGLDAIQMILAQENCGSTNKVSNHEKYVRRRGRPKKIIDCNKIPKPINKPDMSIVEPILESTNVSDDNNIPIEPEFATVSEKQSKEPKGLDEMQMVLARESGRSANKVSNLEKHARRRGRPMKVIGSNNIIKAIDTSNTLIDEHILKLPNIDDNAHISIDLIHGTISENEIIGPKVLDDIKKEQDQDSYRDYVIDDTGCSKKLINVSNCAKVKPKGIKTPNSKDEEKSIKRKHSLKENEMVYVNIKKNKTLPVESTIKSKNQKEKNYAIFNSVNTPLPPLLIEKVESKKNFASDALNLDFSLLRNVLHTPTSLHLQSEPEHEMMKLVQKPAKNDDKIEFVSIEDSIPPFEIDLNSGQNASSLRTEKKASSSGSTNEAEEEFAISRHKSNEFRVNERAVSPKLKSNSNVAVDKMSNVKIERGMETPSAVHLFAKGTSKVNGDGDDNLSPKSRSISTNGIIGHADFEYSPPNLASLEESIAGRYSNIENLVSNPCIANSFYSNTLDSSLQIKRVLDDTICKFSAAAEWHKSEYNKLHADLDRLQEESHCRTSELIDDLNDKVMKILHKQMGSAELRVVLPHEHGLTMLDTYNRNSGAPPLRLRTTFYDDSLPE